MLRFLSGAVFDANEAGEKGGAVYVMEASIESTIMENNKVLHNEGQGGALWISTSVCNFLCLRAS